MPARRGPAASVLPWFIRLQLFPLVLREDPAEPQQHARVRLLKLSARCRYAIDLRQNPAFIRLIGRKQWLHVHLFFLQCRA